MESIVVRAFVGDDVLGPDAEARSCDEPTPAGFLKIGGRGPYIADPEGDVLIGRAATHGLSLEEDWVPRVLATLVPTERCWLVVNGPSARMKVTNRWVRCATATDAVVALPEGTTDLRWPSLPDPLRVRLDVGGQVVGPVQRLNPEPDDVDEVRRGMSGTLMVPGGRGDNDLLRAEQRHEMAELFRHLLVTGEPRPVPLVAPAAERLGMKPELLKKHADRLRERLNKGRFQNLASMDELGEHLIRAGAIDREDLNAAVLRRRRRRPGSVVQ